MSRCKCGKKLSTAEMTNKDPKTGEYLDYCGECLEAIGFFDVDDTEECHFSLEDAQESLDEDAYQDLINEIENNG